MVITNKWKSIMTWSLQNHLYMYIDCYRQDMSPEVILIPPVTGNDQIWLGSDLLTIHVLVLCVIAKKYQIVWRSWTPGVVLTPWNTKWPTILRHVKIRTPRSYIFLFLVLKVLNRNKGHERWGWSWHPPLKKMNKDLRNIKKPTSKCKSYVSFFYMSLHINWNEVMNHGGGHEPLYNTKCPNIIKTVEIPLSLTIYFNVPCVKEHQMVSMSRRRSWLILNRKC